MKHQSLRLYIQPSALLASDQFLQRPVGKLISTRTIRHAYRKSVGQRVITHVTSQTVHLSHKSTVFSQSVSKISPISHSSLMSPDKSNNLSISKSVCPSISKSVGETVSFSEIHQNRNTVMLVSHSVSKYKDSKPVSPIISLVHCQVVSQSVRSVCQAFSQFVRLGR